MKGIKTIKDKIKKEASASARKAKSEAKRQIKEYNQKQEEFKEKYKGDFEDRTSRLLEDIRQKKLAQARLKVKKNLLQAREDIINGIITEIIDNLDHDSEHYKRMLKTTLDENIGNFTGDITIRCSKEDKSAVKDLAGKKTKVDEDSSLQGGLIIEDDTGKRIDESLDMLLERKLGKIRMEIAKVLG